MASFGFRNSTIQYCFDHKEEGMINKSRKRCMFTGCNKFAEYKYINDTFASLCRFHKTEDMVPKEYHQCSYSGCNRKGFYYYSSNTRRKFCSLHREQNMISSKTRLCEEDGCLRNATYNYEWEDFPMFCYIHKQDDMVNKIYPRCSQGGCKRIAIYRNANDVKPSLCSVHKRDGMINVQEVRCQAYVRRCSQPQTESYAYPLFLVAYKTDTEISSNRARNNIGISCDIRMNCMQNMANAADTADIADTADTADPADETAGIADEDQEHKVQRCTNPALYNYPGRRKAIYCEEHKKQGMIPVRVSSYNAGDNVSITPSGPSHVMPLFIKRCQECNRRAFYGPIGTREVIYCYRHKKEDMIDNINFLYEGCSAFRNSKVNIPESHKMHEEEIGIKRKHEDDDITEACELLLKIKSHRFK
jgi:hypothetical protein